MTSPACPKRSVLFLIDLEQDGRTPRSDVNESRGFQNALGHIQNFRRQLEGKTMGRVVFNWFLRPDPQSRKVWGNWVGETFPKLLNSIEENHDYCGIHPHLSRWDEQRERYYSELNDPGWTAECLHASIETFRGIFRRPPEACRFGDRWLNQHAVDLMQASGIRYDLTIEPGMPEQTIFDDPYATGRLPDYRSAPREPYRPAPGNFMVADVGEESPNSLWMVPLTTTAPVWRLIRRPPYLLNASRSPNLALPSANVWRHLRTQLSMVTNVPLAIVVRSGDLARRHFLRNFLHTTRQLVNHPALSRCEFTNPETAVSKWRATR